MTHYISVRTNHVDFTIKFRDKYILVAGHSGEGKSLLVSEIEDAISTGIGKVMSDLLYFVVNKGMLSTLSTIVDKEESLFICDEYIAQDVLRITNNKKAYCFIVTRNLCTNYNMSHRCLFKLVRNDSKPATLERVVLPYRSTPIDTFDLIITEDSGKGFKFIESIFGNKVLSAKGKDKIVSVVTKLKKPNNILLIVDAGGTASYLEKLSRVIKRKESQGFNFRLCLPEYFEHVLLCSDFIKYENDIFKYFTTDYNNTESFCESMIDVETSGKPFEYKHKRRGLSECWIKDCDYCKSKLNCQFYLKGSKYYGVLSNGPAKELLGIVR